MQETRKDFWTAFNQWLKHATEDDLTQLTNCLTEVADPAMQSLAVFLGDALRNEELRRALPESLVIQLEGANSQAA